MTDNLPPEYVENITNDPPLCPGCNAPMTVEEIQVSNVCSKCLNATPEP